MLMSIRPKTLRFTQGDKVETQDDRIRDRILHTVILRPLAKESQMVRSIRIEILRLIQRTSAQNDNQPEVSF